MANDIVPQDDLPDNLVPESDLPETKTYDPRDLVPRAIGAGVGAVGGATVAPMVQSGVARVKAAGTPTLSMPPSGEIPAGHTAYNPRGRTVEQSIENWTNYNRAQLEESKKIRQESKLHKKYPGFTRAGSIPEVPTLPKNATMAQQVAAKVWPNAAQDIGHFAQGVSEYRLPFIGKVGPLVGHLLGGAAAGSQAVDAYNRAQQGDTTGSIISGVGAAGTGVSVLPAPPIVRGVGAGVGLSAEAINAYRDAMARGDIVHGAPENPENVTPMGDQYAVGGLVYLAAGGAAFNPEGADYDYQTAKAHGMGPTGLGENQGHWGSVAPAPEQARQQYNLPQDSYVVLKGKNHETFHKAEAAENARGSKIVKFGDRYYSIPQ
jgi:hypothetical protein